MQPACGGKAESQPFTLSAKERNVHTDEAVRHTEAFTADRAVQSADMMTLPAHGLGIPALGGLRGGAVVDDWPL